MANKYNKELLLERLREKKAAAIAAVERQNEKQKELYAEWLTEQVRTQEREVEISKERLEKIKRRRFGDGDGPWNYQEPRPTKAHTGDLDKAITELELVAGDEVNLTSSAIVKLL